MIVVVGIVCFALGVVATVWAFITEAELRERFGRERFGHVDDATVQRMARELRTHRGGGGWRA